MKAAGEEEENGEKDASDHCCIDVSARLLRCKRVAMVANEVVYSKDMGLLLCNQLANGQWEVLVEYIGVSLLGFILTLFGSLKQSVVSATQFGFHVSPGALKSPYSRARFFYVMDAVLVKDLFKVATEACPLQRFGQEVTFQRLVLEVLANVSKALLAIKKSADQ